MRKLFAMVLLVMGSAAVASAIVTPEIDPASAGSVLALIAGGLLMLSTRRKK